MICSSLVNTEAHRRMSTVPVKVVFFVSETTGLPQWGAKKRMPVKLGCMPANDAAEQWMLMGGEWES